MWNIVDLFCGSSALSYGIASENKDFNVLGGVDLDKDAIETAKQNNKHATFICEDLSKLTVKEMHNALGGEKVDVIVGGPPCQGFSSLQPKRGINFYDYRNKLYKLFIKNIEFLKPKVVLFENVIGIINKPNISIVKDLVNSLESLGYKVDWRIMNAANYGVPQKRERFFLIAYLGKNTNIVFPSPTHIFDGNVIGTKFKEKYIENKLDGEKAITLREAINDLPSLESGKFSKSYRSGPNNQYQSERRGKLTELTLHKATNHSKKMIEVIKKSGSNKFVLPPGMVTSGYSSSYSRLDWDSPCTTITVKFTSPASNKCIHPVDHRAITPREAARIQGFDDDFIFVGSKTSVASQLGNAVPPIFGKVFSNVIANFLEIDY